MAHERPVIGHMVVGREERHAVPRSQRGEPEKRVQHRWRGPAVLRLDNHRPGPHGRQGGHIGPFLRPRHHDQRPLRRDAQHHAPTGPLQQGGVAENRAELLGSVVASQGPSESALSPGQDDPPPVRDRGSAHSTTTWPFIPRSRCSRPPCFMSHPMSNVPLASGVNLISALLPGRSFTYLTPFGASTSISPPSTSRSREARYGDVNMSVTRPRLPTRSLTAFPTPRLPPPPPTPTSSPTL